MRVCPGAEGAGAALPLPEVPADRGSPHPGPSTSPARLTWLPHLATCFLVTWSLGCVQVYQGQVEEGRDWQPFQTAAGSLTLLYKDSLEELQKAAALNRKLVGGAVQC